MLTIADARILVVSAVSEISIVQLFVRIPPDVVNPQYRVATNDSQDPTGDDPPSLIASPLFSVNRIE